MISRAMTVETAGQLRNLLADADGAMRVAGLEPGFGALTIRPVGEGYVISPPIEHQRGRQILSIERSVEWALGLITARVLADEAADKANTGAGSEGVAAKRYDRRVAKVAQAAAMLKEALEG